MNPGWILVASALSLCAYDGLTYLRRRIAVWAETNCRAMFDQAGVEFEKTRNHVGAWVEGNPRGTGDDVSVVAEAERLLEKEARRG